MHESKEKYIQTDIIDARTTDKSISCKQIRFKLFIGKNIKRNAYYVSSAFSVLSQ